MSMNKTDRNDARSLAQLVRSGWFKAVHMKSVESQELRTLLGSREFLVNKLRDHENEIRGQLRPFGLKVGQVSTSGFAERIRELVEGRPPAEVMHGGPSRCTGGRHEAAVDAARRTAAGHQE